ncbi:uncharacterized protein LOC121263320, partial [Juglans microcarpa x Juglans regia]|uniref:uncharacterized protein LOC121263320 n=1 Tax=Juglans microcarpa x Juglans regia TaxID=2249226 RepID=UPI001B7DC101
NLPYSCCSKEKSLSPKFVLHLYCSSSSNVDLGSDDSDVGDYSSSLEEKEAGEGEEEEEEEKSEPRDGLCIEIEKLGKNTRRIRSRIAIDAPLHTIWNILTDYERLSDFIPGLALSQLLQKTHNYARLFQIGQQNLAFGLKFNAKGIVDCYEKELESLPSGQKRDIEFKMVEGDFQLFEGKWSIEQSNSGRDEDSDSLVLQQFYTTLSYLVDVKPKLWLPVRLVEGRLCKEIKLNLMSIREEAQKAVRNTLHVR